MAPEAKRPMTLRWHGVNKAWSVHGLEWHEMDALEGYCREFRRTYRSVDVRPTPFQKGNTLWGIAAPYVGVDSRMVEAREMVHKAITQLVAELVEARSKDLEERLARGD